MGQKTTTGTTITTNSDNVWTTLDTTDYSKELAVLHSNMDDLTKIKIIQALKNNNNGIYNPITWTYFNQNKKPLENVKPTVYNGTGDASYTRQPITISDNAIHLMENQAEKINYNF